jgi:hypothetical protein
MWHLLNLSKEARAQDHIPFVPLTAYSSYYGVQGAISHVIHSTIFSLLVLLPCVSFFPSDFYFIRLLLMLGKCVHECGYDTSWSARAPPRR